MKKTCCLYLFLFMFVVASNSLSLARADDTIILSKDQMIYVPAYSHIYSGDRERHFLLTVTLSIRNIDPKHQIKITTVDYYESQGKALEKIFRQAGNSKPIGIITLYRAGK